MNGKIRNWVEKNNVGLLPSDRSSPGALSVRRSLKTKSVLSPGVLLRKAHRVNPVRILTMALIIRYGLQTMMGTSPGALLSPGVLPLRKAHRVRLDQVLLWHSVRVFFLQPA
jgi:hypothetical protein